MAMNPYSYVRALPRRGFTLLIAVIFTSAFLGFGLALGSLGYKQAILGSSAVDSQYAFYAAEAALECALQMDRQYDPADNPFSFDKISLGDGALTFACGIGFGYPGANFGVRCKDTAACTDYHVTYWRIPISYNNPDSFDGGEKYCADVTVYSPDPAVSGLKTYVFSQGYSVPCSTVTTATRLSARGVQVSY
jgi:hypothetical protein